jgi:hypothetical protein
LPSDHGGDERARPGDLLVGIKPLRLQAKDQALQELRDTQAFRREVLEWLRPALLFWSL